MVIGTTPHPPVCCFKPALLCFSGCRRPRSGLCVQRLCLRGEKRLVGCIKSTWLESGGDGEAQVWVKCRRAAPWVILFTSWERGRCQRSSPAPPSPFLCKMTVHWFTGWHKQLLWCLRSLQNVGILTQAVLSQLCFSSLNELDFGQDYWF